MGAMNTYVVFDTGFQILISQSRSPKSTNQHLKKVRGGKTHASLIVESEIKSSIDLSDKCFITFNSFSVHTTSSISPALRPEDVNGRI